MRRTLTVLPCLLALAAFAMGCTSGEQEMSADTDTRQAATAADSCITHSVLLRAGEIEAIIGDGARIRNHPGVWLLCSEHDPFNVAHNKSALMVGGGLRNRAPELIRLSDTSCLLRRSSTPDDPSDIEATWRISPPYYLDLEHRIRDTADRIGDLTDFRTVGFANYTNSPDDLRVHFLSEGEWFRWIPPEHGGEGSSVPPSFVPEDELEVWPPDHPDPAFWWYKRLDRGFDEPFFYGRLRDMVLIWVFDNPRKVRFFLSPSGGGRSLIPDMTSTAWDVEWIIPRDEYEVGKWYTFRTRMILKRYEGDDDVLAEVEKAKRALGITVPE